MGDQGGSGETFPVAAMVAGAAASRLLVLSLAAFAHNPSGEVEMGELQEALKPSGWEPRPTEIIVGEV